MQPAPGILAGGQPDDRGDFHLDYGDHVGMSGGDAMVPVLAEIRAIAAIAKLDGNHVHIAWRCLAALAGISTAGSSAALRRSWLWHLLCLAKVSCRGHLPVGCHGVVDSYLVRLFPAPALPPVGGGNADQIALGVVGGGRIPACTADRVLLYSRI